VALLLAVSGEEAGAAFPGKHGRIAFDAFAPEPGSTSQIFTINPDRTGERRLTHTTACAYNSSPSYSPDGTKIAWERNGNIWVMDADGTNPTDVTDTPTAERWESGPDWGPKPATKR
jgi:Tol biopolymer transport system component